MGCGITVAEAFGTEDECCPLCGGPTINGRCYSDCDGSQFRTIHHDTCRHCGADNGPIDGNTGVGMSRVGQDCYFCHGKE